MSLKNSPNRFNTLYGAGKSAELLGDSEKAKFYFSALLKNNKTTGSNRERFVHAMNVINTKI
jgi:uncharacterized protein (DUF2225 family)